MRGLRIIRGGRSRRVNKRGGRENNEGGGSGGGKIGDSVRLGQVRKGKGRECWGWVGGLG